MSLRKRLRRQWRETKRQPPPLRVPYVYSLVQGHLPRAFGLACLQKVTGKPLPRLLRFLLELEASGLLDSLAEAENRFAALGTVSVDDGALLYALVRALRPERVVETGTANGASSAVLLAALARNGHGRLVSIDMPYVRRNGEVVPLVEGARVDDPRHDITPLAAGREPGWLVPAELRDRWELRLGDARELLPAALDELGGIELFFHDSLHTREHMLFEFEAAWPRLAPGGVIAADDIFLRDHDALPAFAASVGRPWRTYGGLGFVWKPR